MFSCKDKKIKSYAKLYALPLGKIKAAGFLKEQLVRNKNGMGGHLDELEPEMIADPYVKKSSSPEWDKNKQAGWGQQISGLYWLGLIELAYTLDDAELKRKAEKWVNAVLETQRPDGYLGAYTEFDDMYDDFNPGTINCGMRALLKYYEATGRADVLNAVHRCMLWFCREFKDDNKKKRYSGGNLYAFMAETYHYTGDEKLVRFAEEYAEWLRRNDVFQNSVDAFANNELYYNSNHTVAYIGKVSHPAVLYSANGNTEFLKASINGIEKAQRKIIQRSGAPACNAEYLAPVSAIAETEYCGITGANFSYLQMSKITGNALYGDYMEKIVYNAAQGSRKKDERAIAYMTAPNEIFATEAASDLSYFKNYAPCHIVACCPVNSVLVIPEFIQGLAFEDGQGNLYMNAYGPCEITTDNMTIEEDTLYPFRDVICFKIQSISDNCPETTINFKIPSWCENFDLTVNGVKIDAQRNNELYLPIKRIWKSGDEVLLRFEIKPRIIKVDDTDASGKYPMAIEYGALLFALWIPENWNAIPTRSNTPLPEGWSWFEVLPSYQNKQDCDPYEMHAFTNEQISWNVALNEKLSVNEIEIIEEPATGYVWEKPILKLKLPAYKAPYLFAPYQERTHEIFEEYVYVTKPVEIELVPYGCTNLRISYFPKARI